MSVSNDAPLHGLDGSATPASLSAMLAQLRPTQVTGLLAVLALLLAGAAGGGFAVRMLADRPVIAQLEAETATMRDALARFAPIRTKDEFVTRYLRYMIASDAYFGRATAENKATLQRSRADMVGYIEYLLRRGDELSHEIALQGLPATRTELPATVTFGYDGSTWPLPRVLDVVVPERRPARHNGRQ